MHDPFLHHPMLRGRITDPLKSSFRSFKPSDFDAKAKALGWPNDWRFTDQEIADAHENFLKHHGDKDLWVFGYASLMWDPGFIFAEVRRAHIFGFSRKFCLKDIILRGSPEAPGLQAALCEDGECEGLAFRISKDRLAEESGYFWRRELLGPVYMPMTAKLSTANGTIEALTVVANPQSEWIFANLSHDEQVRYIATGKGMGGTSREYLEGIAAHFSSIGLNDPSVVRLLADVKAFVV